MEVEHGKVIAIGDTHESAQLLRIEKGLVGDSGSVIDWKTVAVAHVNSRGEYFWDGEGVDWEITPEDFDEYYEPALIDGFPCLVKARRDTDAEGGVVTCGPKKGATVHVKGEGGSPICGTTLGYEKNKERRWDPWLKMWKAPKSEKTVFIPSFQVPTCKRCLAKLES